MAEPRNNDRERERKKGNNKKEKERKREKKREKEKHIHTYICLRVLTRTPFSSFHESLKEPQFRIRAKPLQK